jgi:hypothetical protein
MISVAVPPPPPSADGVSSSCSKGATTGSACSSPSTALCRPLSVSGLPRCSSSLASKHCEPLTILGCATCTLKMIPIKFVPPAGQINSKTQGSHPRPGGRSWGIRARFSRHLRLLSSSVQGHHAGGTAAEVRSWNGNSRRVTPRHQKSHALSLANRAGMLGYGPEQEIASVPVRGPIIPPHTERCGKSLK